MSGALFEFDLARDLFPMVAGTLAAVGCGLLGNFLVLRRLSLMGDAISHSVLPGLVIAFLISSSRGSAAMFIGAAAAGLATVVLVEMVKKLGRVESGAAMGVVFSVLFALGVLLIEVASKRGVELDADCVLHGQLETLVWYSAPDGLAGLSMAELVRAVPQEVVTLAVMVFVVVCFVGLLFKELRISAFDPALSTTLGIPAGVMHYGLMVLVAFATVASFEAVGSILVIAMLICPAATARLLTDRLGTQVLLSGVIAVVSAVGGYLSATIVPALWGKEEVNAAGSMTVWAGGLVALAMVFSPTHGIVVRWVRRRRLTRSVLREDLLASLYRAWESGALTVGIGVLADGHGRSAVRAALGRCERAGLVEFEGDSARLTESGRREASALIRRHRLWEHYLVERAGVPADHVHGIAERLEHLPTMPPDAARIDPHGREIPGSD
jgi:manganese/zinc/iron transport system permease protein